LAILGAGRVAPNPMVGCVIVHQNRIIGEGYHEKFGGAHAEVNAINSVKQPEFLKAATLYVSLEPCAHHGKTPPCCDLIIEKQIPRVIVGSVDPNISVSGKGIERMMKAGVEVIVGIKETECREMNRRFFCFHEKKRPYVILKWAQTIDGFIDADRNDSNHPIWITNELCRRWVHKQRSEESAILVGTNTVHYDNPALTVREWAGLNPARLVVDRMGRLDSNLKLFDHNQLTLVFASQNRKNEHNLEFICLDFTRNIIPQILDELYSRNMLSIIVEGGAVLLNSFIQSGQWDEANIFTGNRYFYKGVKAPNVSGNYIVSDVFDDSLLQIMINS
jgi:diaminohydroxyphosphoribosylaminopyrimidine deaminase/5-amino-6-(5-phosphoribosylamino)uracil reductase